MKPKMIKCVMAVLVLLVGTGVLTVTHHVSCVDPTGQWKLVFHQPLNDNPYHEWDGYLYYYGKDVPEKFLVEGFVDDCRIDNVVDGGFHFTDPRTDNASRIFLDFLSLTSPAVRSYTFLAMYEKRPKKIELHIRWNDETTVINWENLSI